MRSIATRTTSASVVPSNRSGDHGRGTGRGTERRPFQRRQATGRDGQQAAGQPRDRQHEDDPTRQVAEIDAEVQHVLETAVEDRIGRGEQDREDQHERDRQDEPASHGPEPGRSAAGDRPSAAGRPARSARPAPATTASRTHAAVAMTTVADRRVTASPENAATEAPVNTAAPAISRNATNGSARTATNAARTSAETGSHASSGSGARPGRRRSQAAASMAAVRIGQVEAEGRSVQRDVGEDADREGGEQDAAGQGTIHGFSSGDAVGAGTTPGALVWRRRVGHRNRGRAARVGRDAARSIGSWAPRRSMHMRTIRPSIARIALIASIAVLLAACAGSASAPNLSPVGNAVGDNGQGYLSGAGRRQSGRLRGARPRPSRRTASARPSTTRRSSGPARSSSRSRMSRRPSSRPATASAPWAATSARPRPRTSTTSRSPPSPTASRPTAGRTRSTCCAASTA